jgi:pimeloyl-ACP methyl ester carboxylesterase
MAPVITDQLLVNLDNTYATMLTRVWPSERSKGTVFCIHGFTGNGTDFDVLAEFLQRNQFTVVCPDMIGRGKSTYFEDAKMYTPENYLICIRALSKYAGERNHFIGTSWGGFIVMLFLYLARVRANKVIFNDVCLRWAATLDRNRNDLLADAAAEFETFEAADAYIRRTRSFLGNLPSSVWSRYVENKVIQRGGKYRLAYDPATTGNFEKMMGRDFDFYPLLPKLKAEILLIYGTASEFYDEQATTQLMTHHRNISCIAGLNAGHPPSLMTLDQALLALGYLNTE